MREELDVSIGDLILYRTLRDDISSMFVVGVGPPTFYSLIMMHCVRWDLYPNMCTVGTDFLLFMIEWNVIL